MFWPLFMCFSPNLGVCVWGGGVPRGLGHTTCLKPTFFRFSGRWGGGGVGGGQKMTPPFFGSKIMNLLVFFDFEPKKCFRVPTLWGLYGAEWDER